MLLLPLLLLALPALTVVAARFQGNTLRLRLPDPRLLALIWNCAHLPIPPHPAVVRRALWAFVLFCAVACAPVVVALVLTAAAAAPALLPGPSRFARAARPSSFKRCRAYRQSRSLLPFIRRHGLAPRRLRRLPRPQQVRQPTRPRRVGLVLPTLMVWTKSVPIVPPIVRR